MHEKLKHCPFCNCWLPGAGGDGARSHPQSKCILSNWIITPHDAKLWNSRPIEDAALASQAADKERIQALERALINMADTWAHYRKCFEHVGAGDAMTGRAWMLCTRAETKARSVLGSGGDEKEGRM